MLLWVNLLGMLVECLSNASLIIPAAGKGERLAMDIPSKSLLDLGGTSVLNYILDLWEGIRGPRVVGIPGGTANLFAATVGSRRCTLMECQQGMGLGLTIFQLLQAVPSDKPVVIVLGDDFSIFFSNAKDITKPITYGAVATQGIARELNPAIVADTCAVQVQMETRRIVGVVEKPPAHAPAWRGCGVYCLSPLAIALLKENPQGLSEAFDRWADAGDILIGVPLLANFNINQQSDLQAAREMFARLEGSPGKSARSPRIRIAQRA